MRPVEEERARRQWLQDDTLLYRGFMKVKERRCAVKERISKMSQGLSLSLLSRQVKTFVVIVCVYVDRNTLEELLCQKKISGGVKKNGGQGDVVVVGFTSHRFRLEEIGFHFNMRYFEDTVTVGEFG
ncbi:hypothetical protein F2Q70_00036577 [Brassica cretica]|uniref:Uncharacterized protein n=1 Tax=Brassica cretica TaxID=69181 RepID=A0A8S9JY45_BRACR|nr:hypothetical protein F2Q70_00036577 [Brassica cretica]